jgi:hypothetical protein
MIMAPIQLAPSWLPRHLQLCVNANVGKELDANWAGAKTFDLAPITTALRAWSIF